MEEKLRRDLRECIWQYSCVGCSSVNAGMSLTSSPLLGVCSWEWMV